MTTNELYANKGDLIGCRVIDTFCEKGNGKVRSIEIEDGILTIVYGQESRGQVLKLSNDNCKISEVKWRGNSYYISVPSQPSVIIVR